MDTGNENSETVATVATIGKPKAKRKPQNRLADFVLLAIFGGLDKAGKSATFETVRDAGNVYSDRATARLKSGEGVTDENKPSLSALSEVRGKLAAMDDADLESRIDRFITRHAIGSSDFRYQGEVMTGTVLAKRLGKSPDDFADAMPTLIENGTIVRLTDGKTFQFAWSNPTGTRGRKPYDAAKAEKQVESLGDLLDSLE